MVLLFPFVSLSDMSQRPSRSSYYDSSTVDSHPAGSHDGRHRHRERSRSPQAYRRPVRSNYSPEQGNHHHSNSYHRDDPRYSRYDDNEDYRPDVRMLLSLSTLCSLSK